MMMLSRAFFFPIILYLAPSRRVVSAQGVDDLIRWVVTFNEGILSDKVTDILAVAGISIPEISLSIPELFIEVFMMDASLAKRVAKLPVVRYVEQDIRVKSIITPVEKSNADIPSLLQQSRQANTEYIPYGIDMVQALDVPDTNVGTRKVCVIDSGYSLQHPDLPGVDVVTGSDTVGVQPWFEDGDGHGTHVAGTVAALGNNGQGVIGVNRNGQLQLHIVRIFDENGEVFSSDTMAYVQDCVNAGANVVSMSFGRSDKDTIDFGFSGPLAYEQAVFDRYYNEGILFVAAAGNDGSESYSWPASYESVMSVAAVDVNMQVASFSQRNDGVDIAAPGVEVASTVPNDEYAFFSGTSMATPHVSGVAALVWSQFLDKSAQEIWQAMTATALDLGPEGKDVTYGYGLVQAAAAVDFLASGGSVPAPTPGPTPVPPTGGCVDDPTWTDPWGDDCDFYSSGFLCQAFGPFSGNGGQTAKDACCSCGGGEELQQADDTPTTVPSSSASLSFSSSVALSFSTLCGLALVGSVM